MVAQRYVRHTLFFFLYRQNAQLTLMNRRLFFLDYRDLTPSRLGGPANLNSILKRQRLKINPEF
jgi:hypothetical protein